MTKKPKIFTHYAKARCVGLPYTGMKLLCALVMAQDIMKQCEIERAFELPAGRITQYKRDHNFRLFVDTLTRSYRKERLRELTFEALAAGKEADANGVSV